MQWYVQWMQMPTYPNLPVLTCEVKSLPHDGV
jgi:hypothetical protein